jgi:hypothetical protein
MLWTAMIERTIAYYQSAKPHISNVAICLPPSTTKDVLYNTRKSDVDKRFGPLDGDNLHDCEYSTRRSPVRHPFQPFLSQYKRQGVR